MEMQFLLKRIMKGMLTRCRATGLPCTPTGDASSPSSECTLRQETYGHICLVGAIFTMNSSFIPNNLFVHF